ncbi:MAG: helix-turn-helix transcriptional regulator [Candidatus Nanopelagicales bacterium]
MPEYRIARAAELLGVSDDTVRRWAESGRLAVHEDATGHRVVGGADLADFARSMAANKDGAASSLAPASARNRLAGIVTAVKRDEVMAQVDMQCGAFRVVSLMSREAADELALEPGVTAVASVKATSVSVTRLQEK